MYSKFKIPFLLFSFSPFLLLRLLYKNRVSFLLSVFCFLLFTFCFLTSSAQKYIFFFIGDGLGAGSLTCCENEARVKGDTLCFSQFPVTGLVTTHSADDWVTCSSAAVTAMACGEKTNNNLLGVSPDAKRVLTPVSQILHQKGYQVGIATSVSIDHATPAGYYAHSISRNNYYDIAKQLPASGFEFFAGSGFLDPEPIGRISLFSLLKENNYAVSYSIQQCSESKSKKNILIQPKEKDVKQFPYSIYKDKTDFTLAQVTQLGIEKLAASDRPFFFMIEGGLIDWAAHKNSYRELYGEVKEFSDAIDAALAFYKENPEETLIIVTADHETGGVLVFSKRMRFKTTAHTGNIVPIFAIGKGSERFSGWYDNTEIKGKILDALYAE